MNGAARRGPGELQAEAATLDVPGLAGRVREGIAGFVAAAETVAGPDLEDLVDTGETAAARIVGTCARLVEDARWILHAAWTGSGPEDGAPPFTDEPAGALAKLRESIESLFVHVLEAAPDANLEYEWEHPVYGDLNWREWLLALAFDAEAAEQDAMAMGAAGS